MERQRDDMGRFVKTRDPLVLVAMLVAVELIVIGACMIYGVSIGHGFERGMERADDLRAILGGILFASGATLGLLGFMR